MFSFVVFDLEFTSWAGALERDWSARGQLREIVQIGALRVSGDYSILEECEVLIRPVVNPRLSPYFINLTGIDQEAVDRCGVSPAQGIGEFLGFCQGQSVLSYGNDMVVLGENVGWMRARNERVQNGYLGANFINVRPWLNAMAPETESANVGRLWKVLGLPEPAVAGGEHSALFDCYSFVAALAHLRGMGVTIPDGFLRGR